MAESPSSGDLDAGKTVTLTSTERGGDGGRRHADADAQRRRHRDLYQRLRHQCADLQLHGGGVGQNTAALTATAVNLNGATITDGAGNAANLSLTRPDPERPADRHHDADDHGDRRTSPASGDLDAGKTVTLTLNLSEAVTVAGGTPTLTLNDGGTATYTSGSGTQRADLQLHGGRANTNVASLAATAVNLNGGDDHRRRRQCRQPSLTRLTRAGRRSTPRRRRSRRSPNSPSSGDLDAGKTVTLTLNLSEAVTVAGGTPTLTLNDGGTATYTSGSGTSALTFSYTVAPDRTRRLARRRRRSISMRRPITDGAGNAANLSLARLTRAVRRSTPRRRRSSSIARARRRAAISTPARR